MARISISLLTWCCHQQPLLTLSSPFDCSRAILWLTSSHERPHCFAVLNETPVVPACLDVSQGRSSLGHSLKSWGLSYTTLVSWPQATTLHHRRWTRLCLKETGRTADERGPGTLSVEINAIRSGSSWHLYKGRCYSYPSCLVPHTSNSPLWDYWRSKTSWNNSHSMWFTALPESKSDQT